MSEQMEFPEKVHGVCDHCGAKMIEYPYNFNVSIKNFLLKLRNAGGKAHKDELVLGHTEYAQASRARYWGLVKMIEEGGREVEKGGLYLITEEGRAFIEGRIRIPRSVYVCRNRVTRVHSDRIWVDDVKESAKKKRFYKDVASSQIGV